MPSQTSINVTSPTDGRNGGISRANSLSPSPDALAPRTADRTAHKQHDAAGHAVVNSYELGSPAGYGATINQRDIADLAGAVYAIPDYHDIDPKEKLIANGVKLSDKQSQEFYQLQMYRLMNRNASVRDMEEETKRITTKVQGVSYENYVASDEELLTLFASYGRGGERKRRPRCRSCCASF